MKTLGQSPSFEEFEQFCKEFDEGKHPLSPEDKEALKRARVSFFKQLAQLTDHHRVITVTE